MAQDSLAQRAGAVLGPLVHGADGVEILAAPDHLVAPAVAALGWDGEVLPPVVLLGRRVAVVAELLGIPHADRVASGWAPVVDRVSVATWSWVEMEHLVPPPAVRLVGVLAPARHWRTALTAAAPFTGSCAAALLLPADVARDGECLRQAARFGVGVVAGAEESAVDRDAVDVLLEGRPGPVPPRPVAASRWVHEVVYERLLAHVS